MRTMNGKWKKTARTAAKAILWTAGIWLALLVILEVALSQPVLTRLLNKYTAEYVDGSLKFGKASISMFKRFPSAVLTLEDVSLTYPADRYDSKERLGVQGYLARKGRGETADTLASFHRFSVGLNLPALITGTIHIPYLRLDRPRIYAHAYADGDANWNIFSFPEEEDNPAEDTSREDSTENSGGLPKIVLGKIMMTGRPHLVYTDSKDTVFAMIDIRKLGFNGKINSKNMSRSKVGLSLDSMFVAGRLAKDTLSLGLDRLHLHEHNNHIDVDAAAKTFLATREFGRLMVPIDITGTVTFPKDTVPAVHAQNLNIGIARIPITADAHIRLMDGRTAVKAEVGIEDWIINDFIARYVTGIMPEMQKLATDAKLSARVECDGEYIHATGRLPELSARIHLPESGFTYSDFPGQELTVGLDIKAETDRLGYIDIKIDTINAKATGLQLGITGKLEDVLGDDPLLHIDGGLHADIDSLSVFIPDTLGVNASGTLKAMIKGDARMSQLNIYNFSQSSLTGEVYGDSIRVEMPEDTLNARINGLKIILGPEEKTFRRDSSRSIRLVGISGEAADLYASYKDDLKISGKDFKISAKNSMETEIEADSTHTIHPFSGRISAKKLDLRDSEGTSIQLNNSSNSFNIFPKKGSPNIPMLTLSSRNKKLTLKSGRNRAILNDANIRANAAMNTVERRQKMKAFRDSLAKVYPDIPKDSLMRHAMSQNRSNRPVPEWMQEEDFQKQDIDISLDKSLAKYFRNWDIKGQMTVGKSGVITPYFPLRNVLEGFEFNFTNDRIAIDRFKVMSGESNISMTGELTGLKRALLGRRGMLKLDVDITSDKIIANQLLRAYKAGMNHKPENLKGDMEDLSDEELMRQIATDTSEVSQTADLIVVPANITADISINASNIRYSGLRIKKVTSNLLAKERCVQITDTKAISNMGDISLEGFYATRSKKDIKTGFCLNFNDITAEKVINLMPAIDTIMPLLKSFGGLLDCELAATAQLDTNMNLIMPTINGIMRIGGEDLTIKNSDMFKKAARLLMFRNKKEGHIDKMTVEGMIKDSKVEVFPFILEMDRYILGLSGVQNMDMSFRYHASLIKSPFLIKLGMDIYGPDFDNMKFKLGKAKYKNKNVPVFTAVIDYTRLNLLESIRNIFDKGVDAAIKESESQEIIESHKRKIGYVQAVDLEMEELSSDEQKQLEAEEAQAEAEEQAASGQTDMNQNIDAQSEASGNEESNE